MASSEQMPSATSEAEPLPVWLEAPFGPGWDDVAKHVQAILDVWSSAGWHGGPVSEQSEDQLQLLIETLGRMERQMRATWPAQAWQEHQTAGVADLPPGATLATQIAHFEYRLVMGWQAQQVQAYWDHLPPLERERQQAEIQEALRTSRPLSSSLSSLPQ